MSRQPKIATSSQDPDSVKGPTFNLFLVNLAFYIIAWIIGGHFIIIGWPAIVLLGFSYQTFLMGFFWTPITSMFAHAHLAHLGANMIFLFIYGFKLEERGYNEKGVYLAYFVTGLVASFFSIPILGNTISVGASGAVFGLLGVNAGIERREGSPNYKSVVAASLILFILSVGQNTNIFAHLFGLLSGVILGNSQYYAKYQN